MSRRLKLCAATLGVCALALTACSADEPREAVDQTTGCSATATAPTLEPGTGPMRLTWMGYAECPMKHAKPSQLQIMLYLEKRTDNGWEKIDQDEETGPTTKSGLALVRFPTCEGSGSPIEVRARADGMAWFGEHTARFEGARSAIVKIDCTLRGLYLPPTGT